jgi:hypothetical protein
MTQMMMIDMIFFSLCSTFFSQSAQGSKERKGASLREMSWRRVLRLQNEGGIETGPFPPSEFQISTSQLVRRNADDADDDDRYDFFSRFAQLFSRKARKGARNAKGFRCAKWVGGGCCVYKMKVVSKRVHFRLPTSEFRLRISALA